MRLDKYLHDLGLGSRKELRAGIARGLALVEGDVVRDPAFAVSAETQIEWEGERLCYRRYHTLMLHKPKGVLSATEDARETTVLDLLPEMYKRLRVAPVGRLDKDTTGLLLLTNDGSLAHKLLRPHSHVPKTYHLSYTGQLDSDAAAQFSAGLVLSDFVAAPALLTQLPNHRAEVVLTEGKFHQVKRMIAAVGGEVIALTRTAFGPLVLDDELSPGQWRMLTEDEETQLREVVKVSGRGENNECL